jgi:hypothetical protein
MQSDVERSRSVALKNIDANKCHSEGGKVEDIGIFGLPACVHYYSDGGNACEDNSDCEGDCFTPEVLEMENEASGMCERSEHDSFGCFSRIEAGRVVTSMCQD